MKYVRTLVALAALAALMVPGCAAVKNLRKGSCNAADLLDYADRLKDLPAGELEEETRITQKAFAQDAGVCDRFRLALQLLTTEPRIRDETRAVKLLNEYAEKSSGSDRGLRSLARLLVGTVRKDWELEARAREFGRKATEEKGRADTLKRQLEELKEIERIMNDRQKR